MKKEILKNMEQLVISPEAIADAFINAISQSKDVQVRDIINCPWAQNIG